MTMAPIDRFMLFPVLSLVLLLLAGQYLAVSTMRSYFRSVEDMQRSLRSLRAENTKCSCCSNGHVDEWGQSIICDREVVNECIKIWFGDQKGFEETIQTAVVEALDRARKTAFDRLR